MLDSHRVVCCIKAQIVCSKVTRYFMSVRYCCYAVFQDEIAIYSMFEELYVMLNIYEVILSVSVSKNQPTWLSLTQNHVISKKSIYHTPTPVPLRRRFNCFVIKQEKNGGRDGFRICCITSLLVLIFS